MKMFYVTPCRLLVVVLLFINDELIFLRNVTIFLSLENKQRTARTIFKIFANNEVVILRLTLKGTFRQTKPTEHFSFQSILYPRSKLA